PAPPGRPRPDEVRAAPPRRAAGNHPHPPRLRGLAGEQHTTGRRPPRRSHCKGARPMNERERAAGPDDATAGTATTPAPRGGRRRWCLLLAATAAATLLGA